MSQLKIILAQIKVNKIEVNRGQRNTSTFIQSNDLNFAVKILFRPRQWGNNVFLVKGTWPTIYQYGKKDEI